LAFEVKWLGYEDASDRTWEPEENLYAISPLDPVSRWPSHRETASDVLKAYFKKIGGRPVKPAGKGKKSKKRGAEAVATPEPTSKRGRKKGYLSATPELSTATAVAASARKGKKDSDEDDWKPPGGSWENQVVDVDTIEEAWDSEKGQNVRFAYVVWTNGRKTRHVLTTLNQKCPQKVRLKPVSSVQTVTSNIRLDASLLREPLVVHHLHP
jgi:chromobox protein 1